MVILVFCVLYKKKKKISQKELAQILFVELFVIWRGTDQIHFVVYPLRDVQTIGMHHSVFVFFCFYLLASGQILIKTIAAVLS